MEPPIFVPDPLLKEVDNQTPFPHLCFDKMGPGRRFHDVVVVRGSFDLCPDRVTLAKEQTHPILADSWWDENNAELSSLREVGDVLLYKPGTDVFVTGTAYSSQRQPMEHWSAGVMVIREQTALLKHFLELTGPRVWQHSLLKGWHLSAPTSTDAVPLRYELAYGGARLKRSGQDKKTFTLDTYKPNPSGTGYFNTNDLETHTRYPGPQIESPDHPVRSPNKSYPLTGFGPVARFWSARKQYAGTYDAAWREQFSFSKANGLAPDFPPDFDLRFYQCAPQALISRKYLAGNERIGLGGMLAESTVFSTHLPGIRIQAHILAAAASPAQLMPLNLDTVHIDLDAQQIHLTWRLCLDPDFGVRALTLDWSTFS